MDDDLAHRIGERARAARGALGWSQADAAERIGISVEFYARIERGRTMPSTPTLVRMAGSLGVTVDGLVGGAKATPTTRVEPKLSPELRRLVRRLGRASTKTVRLLNLVAVALERADAMRSSARTSPPRPKRRR